MRFFDCSKFHNLASFVNMSTLGNSSHSSFYPIFSLISLCFFAVVPLCLQKYIWLIWKCEFLPKLNIVKKLTLSFPIIGLLMQTRVGLLKNMRIIILIIIIITSNSSFREYSLWVFENTHAHISKYYDIYKPQFICCNNIVRLS